MTSQSPRIYIYRITFEEVLYYYYGVHKEKKFGEYYIGSPYTHKWCWEFYNPKKQILEVFDYTDEGWLKAQELEKRIIKPVFNTDKWCLNEHCGGLFSLSILSKAGKKGSKIANFSMTKQQKREAGKKGGQKSYEMGVGVHGRTKEKMDEDNKKAGQIGGKITSVQRWKCTETGFVANPGNLTRYQRVRNIDTSKRKRIE